MGKCMSSSAVIINEQKEWLKRKFSTNRYVPVNKEDEHRVEFTYEADDEDVVPNMAKDEIDEIFEDNGIESKI